MAKKAAHGVVLREMSLERTITPTIEWGTEWERTTYSFFEDGVILSKHDVRFKAGPYDGGKARPHSYGWKVQSRGKVERFAALIEQLERKGYKTTKVGEGSVTTIFGVGSRRAEVPEALLVKCPFRVGDVVKHTAAFLESVGWVTDVPIDGKVVELVPVGDTLFTRIEWSGGAPQPKLIHPKNIMLKGQPDYSGV